MPFYIVGQILGAALGSFIIFAILETGDNTIPKKATRELLFGGASNGFANHSPSGFAFWAVVITEVVFTALFILVIAGTTRSSAIVGFAGIPIGLMLALIHMITIPIDNTSVNPARSFSTVIFGPSWGWEQLWVFIVFPIIGGLIGAGIWRFITTAEEETEPRSEPTLSHRGLTASSQVRPATLPAWRANGSCSSTTRTTCGRCSRPRSATRASTCTRRRAGRDALDRGRGRTVPT